MNAIEDEVAAFERMRSALEAGHMGRWVLIHDGALIGTHEAFEDAAAEAVRRFGSGPFLIRQVGAPPITLPASVMYHHANADGKLRI